MFLEVLVYRLHHPFFHDTAWMLDYGTPMLPQMLGLCYLYVTSFDET